MLTLLKRTVSRKTTINQLWLSTLCLSDMKVLMWTLGHSSKCQVMKMMKKKRNQKSSKKKRQNYHPAAVTFITSVAAFCSGTVTVFSCVEANLIVCEDQTEKLETVLLRELFARVVVSGVKVAKKKTEVHNVGGNQTHGVINAS